MHKILYLAIIVTLGKLKSEEKFLNMLKGNYGKSRATIILNSEILNIFLLRSGIRHIYPSSCLYSTVLTRTLKCSNPSNKRQEKEIKNIEIRNKEANYLTYRYQVLYIDNAKYFTN